MSLPTTFRAAERQGRSNVQSSRRTPATIAILDEPEVTSVQDRVKGFKLGMRRRCPNVEVVADVDSGGARDKANSDPSDILQAHKNLKGIFGINDDTALGAVTAIRAGGRPNIAVIGYDATTEAARRSRRPNVRRRDAGSGQDRRADRRRDSRATLPERKCPRTSRCRSVRLPRRTKMKCFGAPGTPSGDARHREILSRCSRTRRRHAGSVRGRSARVGR